MGQHINNKRIRKIIVQEVSRRLVSLAFGISLSWMVLEFWKLFAKSIEGITGVLPCIGAGVIGVCLILATILCIVLIIIPFTEYEFADKNEK
jgi:hypothetical protein